MKVEIMHAPPTSIRSNIRHLCLIAVCLPFIGGLSKSQEKDTYLEGTRNLSCGDLQLSEQNLRRAIAVRNRWWRKQTAVEKWIVADASNSLGVVLVREGRYAEGEAILRNALDVARATSLSNDGLSAAVTANLSVLYKLTGRIALAETFAEEASDLCLRLSSDKAKVFARI